MIFSSSMRAREEPSALTSSPSLVLQLKEAVAFYKDSFLRKPPPLRTYVISLPISTLSLTSLCPNRLRQAVRAPPSLSPLHPSSSHDLLPLLHSSFPLTKPSTSRPSPLLSPLPLQMYHSVLGSSLQTRQAALEASNFTSPLGGGGRMVLVVENGLVSAEFPWGVRSDEREKGEKMVAMIQKMEESLDGGLM